MNGEPAQYDLVDLGPVTAGTKGGHWGAMDQEGTLKTISGLTDE